MLLFYSTGAIEVLTLATGTKCIGENIRTKRGMMFSSVNERVKVDCHSLLCSNELNSFREYDILAIT